MISRTLHRYSATSTLPYRLPGRQSVSCGDCHLCCQNTLVLVSKEIGDDPDQYDCEPIEEYPDFFAIRVKPNGDCIYLSDHGCSIHDHAPIMCQVFSCAAMAKELSPRDVQKGLRDGLLDPEVLKKGRELLRAQRSKRFPSKS